jgi:hypothetical protein
VIVADWSDAAHWNRGRQTACIHCGRPTMLLDDAGRPAHKVCGEAALAALLGQPTREAGSFKEGRVGRVNPPPVTPDDVQSYPLCGVCAEQELWYPPSQERGVCARCWRAMDAEGTP